MDCNRPYRVQASLRTAAVLFAATSVLLGCGAPEPPPEILRPVRSETVYATGGERTRSFSGTARAGLETQLSFRVPGRVERLEVRVGDSVGAGQLIAQLEPRDFEIAVEQAEATLAQALADFRDAEADLARIRGLWENRNVSQADLDQATARAEANRARVRSAQQSLESAQRQLGYASLKAPVDGRIAAVPVEVNENVAAGQTVVLLTGGRRPEVVVAIPEVLISQIQQGRAVEVAFDALPGVTFDATVIEVGVAATGGATTFPVRVQLDRERPEIRSGMAADVTFRFESTGVEERIYVPSHAVGEDPEGRFVFLLEDGGEPGVAFVRRTAVQVGELTQEGLEILAGLDEGAEVVTAGVRRLSDGQRVKRLPASAAP